MEAREHRSMLGDMLREVGVVELSHVRLFRGEMPFGTFHQLFQKRRYVCPLRTVLNHFSQAIDDLEQLLVLLINDPDARVVPRIPQDFHDPPGVPDRMNNAPSLNLRGIRCRGSQYRQLNVIFNDLAIK
jgi:hypothetical protein